MGVVYEAFDRERRQLIAVKTLLRFSPGDLYRFKQEFRALADVAHPNLVNLYELVATDSHRVFFTMELVRGVDFLTYTLRPDAALKLGRPASLLPTTTLPKPVAIDERRERVVDDDGGSTEPLASPSPQSPADLDRLRPALRQLVDGVNALHAVGKLHRDIKPSNVLVTAEGRVVLLDFGVATDMSHLLDNDASEREVVGTARYMAPEQALKDHPPSAASDWYSVGVMLYEALVGRPPFGGSMTEVLTNKNLVDPPPPSHFVEGVPAELESLCCALLRRQPESRPTGRDILRLLEGPRALVRRSPVPPGNRPSELTLIGRDEQRRRLGEAFEAAKQRRPVALRLHGRSGMGRSTLAASFLAWIADNDAALVLRGRAYERESVPYKALDHVIDVLSRHLMRVCAADRTTRLPRDVGALARLFPVLRRVDAVAVEHDPTKAAPQKLRRQAVAALRELFAQLAAKQPIVLCIEDVQWGDADSAELLIDLVRPPFEVPLLLILTYRDEDAEASPFLLELAARWPMSVEVRDIGLPPLALEDARNLALGRLGASDSTAAERADAIAREAGGNPFIVDELARSVRQALRQAGSVPPPPLANVFRFDRVVEERMSRLSVSARRLLEVIAVTARPLPIAILGDAATVDDTMVETLASLRAARFVRTGLRDGREVVEMFHDRIRETVVARLGRESVRTYHHCLARALEAVPDRPADALAEHLLGAGEKERAAMYAERAAEEAASKLAFAQAVRFYEMALGVTDEASAEARRLRVRLARVLEGAGRGTRAAAVYMAAAAHARGIDRVELERSAAEQLLTCGHVDEGELALRRIMQSVGMRAPRTVLGALLWGLVCKVALRMLGLRFQERDTRDVSRVDHVRIEALYAVAIGMGLVNVAFVLGVQAHHLLLALRKGDRVQALRAAGIEAIEVAGTGRTEGKRERALTALVDRLADESNDLDLRAFASATKAIRAFLRGRWRQAFEALDRLYDVHVTSRAGWHSNAHLFLIWAVSFLGRMAELRRRQATRLAFAEETGDLYTTVSLRIGHSNAVWLAEDDVETARRHVREAMACWSQRDFFLQQYRAMLAEATIELYVGAGERAFERVARDWRALRRSFLLHIQYLRADAHFLRARCALASLAVAPNARLADAIRMAHKLDGERMEWTAPLAALVWAGIAAARGDRDLAVARLRDAISGAEAADMLLHAAAARLRLGALLGGEAGNRHVAEAREWMSAQEIRVPERFAAMLAPGF
jgi:serine/threonine protein kinase